MAPFYPDRRGRYSVAFPWEAGTVVSTTQATRGPAPRDSFRVVTAEPPDDPPSEWTQNERGEWVKVPVKPEGQSTAPSGESPSSLANPSVPPVPTESAPDSNPEG